MKQPRGYGQMLESHGNTFSCMQYNLLVPMRIIIIILVITYNLLNIENF